MEEESIISNAKHRKPTVKHIGEDRDHKVLYREHLSPTSQEIMACSKKFKESYYIWSKNGKVHCKNKVEGSKAFLLKSMEDVEYMQVEEVRPISRQPMPEGKPEGKGDPQKPKRQIESPSSPQGDTGMHISKKFNNSFKQRLPKK